MKLIFPPILKDEYVIENIRALRAGKGYTNTDQVTFEDLCDVILYPPLHDISEDDVEAAKAEAWARLKELWPQSETNRHNQPSPENLAAYANAEPKHCAFCGHEDALEQICGPFIETGNFIFNDRYECEGDISGVKCSHCGRVTLYAQFYEDFRNMTMAERFREYLKGYFDDGDTDFKQLKDIVDNCEDNGFDLDPALRIDEEKQIAIVTFSADDSAFVVSAGKTAPATDEIFQHLADTPDWAREVAAQAIKTEIKPDIIIRGGRATVASDVGNRFLVSMLDSTLALDELVYMAAATLVKVNFEEAPITSSHGREEIVKTNNIDFAIGFHCPATEWRRVFHVARDFVTDWNGICKNLEDASTYTASGVYEMMHCLGWETTIVPEDSIGGGPDIEIDDSEQHVTIRRLRRRM